MTVSGIINPQTRQPQVTSGQQVDQNSLMTVMSQFNSLQQTNPQLFQQLNQRSMMGQPIYFSAQLIQNPYGVNGYQQPYGQQPYGQPYGYPNPYQNPYQQGFYQQPYTGQAYPQAGVGLYQVAPGTVSFY